MEDQTLIPSNHALRPHHITLLAVFILALKEIETKNLAPAFSLHIYRVLLNEVSEIYPPKSWDELLRELSSGPMADVKHGPALLNLLQGVNNELRDANQLSNFFATVPSLFLTNKEYEQEAILMPRHIFGYFCRRCFVSFLKMSFSGVVKFHNDYKAWCNGDLHAGYEVIHKDSLENSYLLLLKTNSDKKSWAQPHLYERFEAELTHGDEIAAEEHLRWFFEQRFHEGNDSALRQHAILNLARFHYIREEYPAARKYLAEAITTARTAGDKVTLQYCISLLNRLPPAEMGRKPVINEIQPDLHPLEVLFDIKKLMDPEHDQNLSASFSKLAQAIGMFDHWNDTQSAFPLEAEQWSHHAVQSAVWSAAGCPQLAVVEENIVTAFTDIGGDDNNRTVVVLNRAYRHARQGQYQSALAMLLEPGVWEGLSTHDYLTWASQVWQIMALRASRQGQERLFREVLLPHKPAGDVDSRDYFFGTGIMPSKIRGDLHEVIRMRERGQATTVVEQLLTALWRSEFQGRMDLYRTGILLLADVGLEFGMTKRCRVIVEEIMPQIITGQDLEQRAFACFTLARCVIAAENGIEQGLMEALNYLQIAEADLKAISSLSALSDVQYLISVVYDKLNMLAERDEAALRHFTTLGEKTRLKGVGVDEEVVTILQVMADVGTLIAVGQTT